MVTGATVPSGWLVLGEGAEAGDLQDALAARHRSAPRSPEGHSAVSVYPEGDRVAEPEEWQVSTAAAEVYESCFVPAIFRAWAGRVADAAVLGEGDKVLDVGCGTGVLAREANQRVGADGAVVGLDLNAGMLSVAARTEPGIEWRHGNAAALPFPDRSFDAVVSQFALMYFRDRVAALREMWRTLAPGGRLAVATWASIDQAPGYQRLVDLALRHGGPEAANVLAAPFVLGDRAELAELFRAAGIPEAEITLHRGSVRFASIEEFVRVEINGSPLAEMVSDEVRAAWVAASEAALVEFVAPTGELVMPIAAQIVTARQD
jgi:ubiquinone/menaquinone biosynthesis C-methylase UbiE